MLESLRKCGRSSSTSMVHQVSSPQTVVYMSVVFCGYVRTDKFTHKVNAHISFNRTIRLVAGIEGELDAKLQANGVKEGDDLVVMVINQGEIDLFLNFACSCKLHNISLSNVMVFAGSRYAYTYAHTYTRTDITVTCCLCIFTESRSWFCDRYIANRFG